MCKRDAGVKPVVQCVAGWLQGMRGSGAQLVCTVPILSGTGTHDPGHIARRDWPGRPKLWVLSQYAPYA